MTQTVRDAQTGWQRHVHAEPVWGTVVTFDIRDPELAGAQVDLACARAAEELHRIDSWLSPFRADSAISAIRAGRLLAAHAPPEVRDVLDACADLTVRTAGAFDVWRQPGGVDPCGFVKGWGADRAADILADHGLTNVSVNAAGDVSCRGSSGPSTPGWRIGIVDPRSPGQLLSDVLVRDAHLATSGRYERGDHVRDPRTGEVATGVDSASVLARDGGWADAWATALLILGPAGLARLADDPCSAMVVASGQVWTIGPAWAASD